MAKAKPPKYSIGAHQFFTLSGVPDGPKQRLVLVARAGVDGVGIWQDAVRGKPFTLRSAVDCKDLKATFTAYAAYKDSIGADPVDVIWNDKKISDDGYKIVVLDVRVAVRKPILPNASGGLNPPSEAWLECDWDVVEIAVE